MTLFPNSAGHFVTMDIASGGEHLRRKSPSRPLQPPQLSCNADWGTGHLLPAVGTIAHTTEHCTKRSHRNRFDACMAPALASARVWSAAAVPEWAVAPVGAAEAAVPGWAVALELVRRAQP